MFQLDAYHFFARVRKGWHPNDVNWMILDSLGPIHEPNVRVDSQRIWISILWLREFDEK